MDPAIKGTTGILKSIHAHAPSVKRVVITSSSAAILHPPNHPEVYDESSWSDVTWEQALDPQHTYRASKVTVSQRKNSRITELSHEGMPLTLAAQKFAEQAAWSFLTSATPPPNFTLATINNSYTFGPAQRSLASPAEINTSNHRIRDLVAGRFRTSGVPPTAPVFTFVDVRDVALAHVRALTVPEAAGKRFYVVGGYFSNTRIAEIVRRRFPMLKDVLPDEAEDDFPTTHWRVDTSRSREVLGVEYKGLEESVVDTVESILALERRTDGREECLK